MYRCKYLAHGLYIGLNEFRHCCLYFHSPEAREEQNFIINYYGPKKSKVDWEEVFSKKKKLLQDMRDGIIPAFCKGCRYIEEFDEDSENQYSSDFDNYIDIVWIGHSNHCNARCMYCNAFVALSTKIDTKDYGVIKLLEEMLKKKIYNLEKAPDSIISFAHGEPLLLNSFDGILKLFEKYGNRNIALYTNGIKYSRMVEKFLKHNEKVSIRVIISLDSGSREVFKKIKMVDKFNNVVKTIKKYSKAVHEDNPCALGIKYIIVPKINDTKEEIDKFYDLCVNKLGVKYLMADIEEHWFIRHNGDVPDYIKELLVYLRDRCKKDNINFDFFDRAYVLGL